MLVSHESPIDILYKSKTYNDYDYALVHLFDTNPRYYNFFKCSLAEGREVLLDNSIFELGVSFNPKAYAKYIDDLKPTFFIVPDVLEDSYATMSSYHKFTLNYPDLPGYRIGVVQGKTYAEIVDCYNYMSEHADYIAISFDYSWYNTVALGSSKLVRFCNGRPYLIKRLINDGIWNYNKPHHLLGCSLAREFGYYKRENIPGIRSCDTSNPVVAALKGKRYMAGFGLKTKPSTLLADLIDHEVSEDELEDILYNTSEFKKIITNE